MIGLVFQVSDDGSGTLRAPDTRKSSPHINRYQMKLVLFKGQLDQTDVLGIVSLDLVSFDCI